MESKSDSWWSRNGWTVLVLLAAFSLTFLIRTLWNIPLFEQYGTSYFFAGGSDSFYHWRVSDYIILNHKNLIFDPLLKYPVGAINPREPLFDWMNAVFGILFAPLFGGSSSAAGMFSLELAAPLWAALSVFPVYWVGTEFSSKRMGLIAALIWPFLVANIDSSTFGYSNYLSFYTFFILIMIYAYLRTIRAAGTRKWVASYRKPRDILQGLKDYYRYERSAVKWAVFTGVSFAVVVLTWQGYTFLVALVVVFLVVQMIIERIRRIDSFGMYLTTWIVGLVGFPLAFPYYYVQGDYHIWFLEPVVIYFGALLVLLPFLVLRDNPWVVSIPVLILTSAAAVGALALAAPAQFADILSGQGYFVKTLIYSTVAEAQAPSIDSLIIGYGVVTFFMAFAGLGFVLFQMIRGRFERRHLLFFLFGVISIYLPISAAKFFYIGSAAFCLLPAETATRFLDIGGYPTLRRNVVSLSDRRSQLSAFRRSFKARHVLVFLLIVALIVPNVWYGIDAGIPYNTKAGYDTQVYDSLPAPLRVAPTNASSYYFGAAGSDLDTPNQYDEAGYDWLATQDTNLPEPQRPALVSWWDYGFQTIAEGDHPSVADNFQNGIDPSGNFLLSQNESLAIGVLTTTLLSAEALESGQPYLPAALNQVLANDGVNLPELHTLLANTSADLPLVEDHPGRYVAVDPSTITADNAMYDAVSYFLASTLPLSRVAQVYDDVQGFTGWSIRYPMVDSRLIPFSGSDTGIFYAPADLTGRVIGPGGEPTSYFTVSVVGSDGNTYAAGALPAGVTAVSYNINYSQAFYNTMIYKTYFGYDGQQVGQTAGIPWLTSSNSAGQTDPIEPGWMLQHFQVVYRTAYECPQANASAGSTCFNATNVPTAEYDQAKLNGTADTSANSYFNGGEAILEYYPGVTAVGTVELPNGRPVSDAQVTVYDSWGIPHMTMVTGADGAYSLVLPPGQDTINVSTGPLNPLTQAGATHLATFNISVPDAYGLSLDAPTMMQPLVVQPSTIQGFLTWSSSTSSASSSVPVEGASVVLWGQNDTRLAATTDASGAFSIHNVPPAVYNVSVDYRGSNFTESEATALPGKLVNETLSLSAGEIKGNVTDASGSPAVGALVTVTGTEGVVATGTANSTGQFDIENLGPGNYTVAASAHSPLEEASGQLAELASPGANVSLNFTIVPVAEVSVQVLKNGAPIEGTPVRFTEILPPVFSIGPTNNSTGAHRTQAQANTSVALTDAAGIAQLMLPSGNYSIYALGFNGSGYYAGYWSGSVGPGPTTVPAISVYPASELLGYANGTTNSSISAPIEVAAYNHAGDVVWAFANLTDQYSLWLPSGPYSVLAFSPSPNQAALAKVTLAGPTRLDLAPSPTSLGTTVVTANGTGRAIAGAMVNFTLEQDGATVSATTDSVGNASALLPTAPTLGVPQPPLYCVNVSALGYLSHSDCGINGGALPSVVSVHLVPAPVLSTILIEGLPSGTSVHVNLTAVSVAAHSVQAAGTTPIALTVDPGTYSVTAWAPGAPSGFYYPVNATTWTVGPGAIGSSVTLRMVDQVLAHGSVTVPSGASATSASVEFLSAVMNLTVRGPQLSSGFYLAPGPYEYVATVPGLQPEQGWIAEGSVTVSGTGTLSTSFHPNGAAVTFEGSVDLPSAAPLLTPSTVTFVNPSGFAVPSPVADGSYNVTLPANLTYTPYLNVTTSFPLDNVTVVEALSVPLGQSCTVRPLGTICDLNLVGKEIDLSVGGRLAVANSPALVPGSVLFEGPSPSNAITTVPTSVNGSFDAELAPGTYTVYANSTGGTYAELTTVLVSLGSTGPLTLTLSPAWIAALTILPPPGRTIGAISLTLSSSSGYSIVLPDVIGSSVLSLPLPSGTYEASASAPSSPYGVPTNATASVTFNLFTGNVGLTIPLVEEIFRAVHVLISLPTNITQGIELPPSGGTVYLGFTVRNTGDIPVNVTVVGTPSTWNFTVTPANFTLGTGSSNDSAAGEFSVRLPAGTVVAHAPILLVANLAGTSQQIGQSPIPAPIGIQPRGGLTLGESSSVELTVTPTRVTVPLYALNTGNLAESVVVSVVNGASLAQSGWTSTVESAGSTVSTPLSIAVLGNTSVSVVLNASLGHAQPPGSVTVLASVVNRTGGEVSSMITVAIPVVPISVNGSSFTVTGPNVGAPSATPDWLIPLLVFVPAMAFLVALVVHRWYTTRRWVR